MVGNDALFVGHVWRVATHELQPLLDYLAPLLPRS